MPYLQATRIRKINRSPLPGLLLAAAGALGVWVAAGLPFRLPTGRPGPGFVPQLLAGALVALGLLAAWRGSPLGEAASPRPGVMLCGAVLAFALLLPWAGFLPACWVAATLSLLAAPGWPAPRAVLAGAAIAGSTAALFAGLLGVPLPLLGPR